MSKRFNLYDKPEEKPEEEGKKWGINIVSSDDPADAIQEAAHSLARLMLGSYTPGSMILTRLMENKADSHKFMFAYTAALIDVFTCQAAGKLGPISVMVQKENDVVHHLNNHQKNTLLLSCLECLKWMTETLKFQFDQQKSVCAESEGGYSKELTEAMELVKILEDYKEGLMQ